jgi:hypothetical protein
MSVEGKQTALRLAVLTWAFAYEVLDASPVTDYEFDKTCKEVDVSVATDDPVLDAWFREHFDPCTGV